MMHILPPTFCQLYCGNISCALICKKISFKELVDRDLVYTWQLTGTEISELREAGRARAPSSLSGRTKFPVHVSCVDVQQFRYGLYSLHMHDTLQLDQCSRDRLMNVHVIILSIARAYIYQYLYLCIQFQLFLRVCHLSSRIVPANTCALARTVPNNTCFLQMLLFAC